MNTSKRGDLVRTFDEKVRTKGANYLNVFVPDDNVNEINSFEHSDGWLTQSEGANLEGIGLRAFQKRCKNGKYIKIRRVKGNGGERIEVHVNELSPSAIERYRRIRGLLVEPSEMAIAVRDAEFMERAAIADWQKDRALLRFAVISSFREFVSGAGWGELLGRKEQFCRMYNERILDFPERVREFVPSVSVATIDRWVKVLDDAGGDTFALAPDYGKSRGRTKVSEDECQLLLSCALVPGKPIKMAIDDFRKLLTVRGQVAQASDATYARILDRYRKDNYGEWTFAREGGKALNDKVLPYLERDRNRLRVGDMLVSDGHKFNFDIIDPVDGKAKRMILVLVYDFFSGMPVGWEISRTENTAAISMAYYRAIKALGFVPRYFYLDNGRAYRAKTFTKVNNNSVELDGLFQRLKPYGFVGAKFAKPYHGQSKPIERFFRTVDGGFSRNMETYRGNSIENKNPWLLRNEKEHGRHHEAMTGGFVPSVMDVHRRLVAWIEEYATMPTSRQHGLRGAKPFDAFSESMEVVRASGDFSSRCVSEDALRFLMMDQRKPKIDRNGLRLFGGRRYWHEELFGMRDRDLVVRYDLMDLSRVWVFDEQGKDLLCVATEGVFSGVHPAAELDEDVQRVKDLLEVQSGFKKGVVSNVKDIWKGQLDDVARALPPVREPERIEPAKKAVGADLADDAEYEEYCRRRDAAAVRLMDEQQRRDAEDREKYSIYR